MSNLPSLPLARVISLAAKLAPVTGATARAESSGYNFVTILADVSGSMDQSVAPGRRRIDVLRDALALLRADTPAAGIVAFCNLPTEIAPDAPLPEPGGGTALHLALGTHAARAARTLVVVTDGEPDDEHQALAVARDLRAVIHAIYCGDDGNASAIDFLRRLTRAGRGGAGTVSEHDLRVPTAQRLLACDLRRLALPRP